MNKKKVILFIIGLTIGTALLAAVYFLSSNFSHLNDINLSNIKAKLPKAFIVHSGSMNPTLPVGSLIIVKPENNYTMGDVVSYKHDGGQIVTHRISKIITGRHSSIISYETKGDVNNTPDNELVSKNQVIGKMIIALPYIGYVISFLKTQTGLTIFILIPALIIIFSELLNIKTEAVKIIAGKKSRQAQIYSSPKNFSHLREMQKKLAKFLLFALIIFLPSIKPTNAFYSDQETTAGNTFAAGYWEKDNNCEFGNHHSCMLRCYFRHDRRAVKCDLSGIKDFSFAEYEIRYSHRGEYGDIEEQIIGRLTNYLKKDNLSSDWIELGTCSNDGVCVYHGDVTSVFLNMVLNGKDNKTLNTRISP